MSGDNAGSSSVFSIIYSAPPLQVFCQHTFPVVPHMFVLPHHSSPFTLRSSLSSFRFIIDWVQEKQLNIQEAIS